MASRPRKISELRDSATKIPRMSRIAQPIRRTAARESSTRSHSLEPEQNRDLQSAFKPRSSSAVRNNATPLTRSSSAVHNSATPLPRSSNPVRNSATPLPRSSNAVRNSATPLPRSSNAVRNSATPMYTPLSHKAYPNNIMLTSEKALAEDKKWIQTQLNRLNEYVKQSLPDIGNDLSSKGGLKSMTTRHFIGILSHFISLAAGNKFKISNNTYVDDIIKILPQLEYPYTINKSSLKSINAPHSFGHIIVLLSWFMDFTNPQNSLAEIEDEEYLVGWENDFPSAAYTKYFIEQAKRGFLLWNSSEEIEYNNLKSLLIDRVIALKTDMKFANVSELEKHIDTINHEYEHLVKNKITIKNEINLDDLNDKCNVIESNIKKMQQYINDKNSHIKNLKRHIHDNHEIIIELKDQLASLQVILKDQKMNVAERDSKINEINIKNLLLTTKINSISELENLSTSNQTKYIDLINKKFNLTTTLYNLLIKLETKLVNFKNDVSALIDQFNSNFKINTTMGTTSKVQLLVKFLGEVENLNTAYLEEQNYYKDQSRNLQIELSALKNHNTNLANDINKLNSKLDIAKQFNQSQLDKILNDIVANNKVLNELNITLMNKNNNIMVFKKMIENNLVLQNQLMESIEELKRDVVKTGDTIIAEKEKKLDKLQSIFKQIDELFEEIGEF